MLVEAESKYADELRADFQQYYRLNIDDMGNGYTYQHAAVLVSQLPIGSRVLSKMDPRASWTQSDYLLSLIEYDLRVLAWQKTKDAEHGRNKPKPPLEPKREQEPYKVTRSQMEKVAKALNIEI